MTSSDAPQAQSASRARTAITTPDLYRTASIVVAVSLALLTIVAVSVVLTHRRATDELLAESMPLAIDAQELYVALAAADASASGIFLQAGFESPNLRARYLDNLAVAETNLIDIASGGDASASVRTSLESIAADLAEYAGLIEAARANNRLDFPVGAAYQRNASDLMVTSILPAATSVYEQSARALDQSYQSGTTRVAMTVLLVVSAITLALLVGTQVLVARRSRRLLNPGLLVATVLVVGVAVAAVVLLEAQHRSLASSRVDGADPLVVASASRILLLRSLSDENLDLIERGTVPRHMEDFDRMEAALAGDGRTSGWIDEVAASPAGANESGESLSADFDDYLDLHQQVRALAAASSFDSATDLAVGEQASVAQSLDTALGRIVEESRTELEGGAQAADDRLRLLFGLAVLLPLIAAVCAVLGVQRRIREYR